MASSLLFQTSRLPLQTEKENAENNFVTTSEYKIGHTLYTTTFNPASKESLSDILKRLIIRDCEKILGESGQEPEKQAV